MPGTIEKGLIGKEDLALCDGSSSLTFTRTTSSGYDLTLTKINLGSGGGGGGGLSLMSYGCDLATAVAEIGSDEVTLNIDCDDSIEANLVCPETLNLRFIRGSVLTIANGVTLTIGNMTDPGGFQIFAGTGTVVLADGSVDIVRPDWWGAVFDGVTDDGPEVLLAINAAPYGATIKMHDQCYNAGTEWYMESNTDTKAPIIEGPCKITYGGTGKCFHIAPSDPNTLVDGASRSYPSMGPTLNWLTISATQVRTGADQCGIYIKDSTGLMFTHVTVTNFTTNWHLVGDANPDNNGFCENIKLLHCRAGAGTYGLRFSRLYTWRSQSFGDLDVDQFKITGIPDAGYGVYLPEGCSIYRSRWHATIFPKGEAAVGFYADGRMTSSTGSVNFEPQANKTGVTENYCWYFGPHFKAQNVHIVSNFTNALSRYTLDPTFPASYYTPTGFYETTAHGLTSKAFPGERHYFVGVHDAEWTDIDTIASISSAASGVVTTTAAHGIVTGDEITFSYLQQDDYSGVLEDWGELNQDTFEVTVTDTDKFSIPHDTTIYPAYDPLLNPLAKVRGGAIRLKGCVTAAGYPTFFVKNRFDFFQMGSNNFEAAQVRSVPLLGTGTNDSDVDTTPNVAHFSHIKFTTSVAGRTITRFDNDLDAVDKDPLNGHILCVKFNDANTTLKHHVLAGENIMLKGKIPYNPPKDTTMMFVYDGTVAKWMEYSRTEF